jgi:hypothetical protein
MGQLDEQGYERRIRKNTAAQQKRGKRHAVFGIEDLSRKIEKIS